MKNRGFTLIEVLVVIGIFAVLTVALGFQFAGWQGRYKVEKQIKEIHADLMDARVRAMRVNRVHFVSLVNATEYTMHDDTSDGTAQVPDGDGILQLQTAGEVASDDRRVRSFPKPLEFDISWNNNTPSAENLEFNTRGLAINPGTISIFVDRDSDGKQDFIPDYDCIVISATRLNLGQLDVNETAIRSDDVCTQK